MWTEVLCLFAVFSSGYRASETVFSVQDDVLAYPQFDVVFSDSYVSDAEATRRLGRAREEVLGSAGGVGRDERSLGPLALGRHHHDHYDKSDERQGGYGHSMEDGEERRIEDDEQDYERMLMAGRPYLCSLPRIKDEPGKVKNESTSEAVQETDLAMAAERGWELLQDLEGKCMFFVSGWWSYSFCYNSQIKQFHRLSPGSGGSMYPPQEDPSTPSYVLGRVGDQKRKQKQKQQEKKKKQADQRHHQESETSATTELQVKGDTRYLVQKMAGGTTCDLTGKERKVEVQFHCRPQSTARIGWIKEVATCAYLMIIYHPRLCNDIAFLPTRNHESHTIACREIIRPDQIADWQHRKSRQAERQLIGEAKEGSIPLMAGDVEIGAMKEVGTEGRRLQKGRVVSGPDEAEEGVETIAQRKKGKVERLSREDLESLNLNADVVDDFRKEIQTLAADRDWRLERVVDGRGIIQLRAVVTDDNDEGPDGGDGGGTDRVGEEVGVEEEEEQGGGEGFRGDI